MTTKTINISEARDNLAKTIKEVVEDAAPVVIKSKKMRAVLISESDFQSLIETAYLLSSAANADRLHQARKEVREGKTFTVSDDELDSLLND